MRRRGQGAIVGCVAALSLLVAPPAGAATQVGNACAANSPAGGVGLIGLANQPGSPFPAAMPTSGVLTQWSTNIALAFPPGVLTGALKVMRPTGIPTQYQVVGESTGSLVPGSSSFNSRIAVQAGDQLGFVAWPSGDPENTFALYCGTTNPGDRGAVFNGNPSAGTTLTTIGESAGVQVPVVATLEPDADNDGFGDETQDGCPQAAVAQGPCPPVAVDASSVIKRKGSVVVLVTTDSPAPVTVAGTANLGKGKKAKLRSKAQSVVPGKVTKFTLNFPRKLKNRLKELARKRSLQLQVTATATDPIGRVTTDTLKTRLKGQAKPQPKGRRR